MVNQRFTLIALLAFAVLVLIDLFVSAQQPNAMLGESIYVLPAILFPAVASAGMFCFSVVAILRDVRSDDTAQNGTEQKGAARWTLLLLGLILVSGMVLEHLGYVLTMGIAAGVLSYGMGNRRLFSFVALCLLVPILAYWIVTSVFVTHLPVGAIVSSVLH